MVSKKKMWFRDGSAWLPRHTRKMIRANTRIPALRIKIRADMIARLKAEVTKREIKELLDKQGHGVTKQKRRITVKKTAAMGTTESQLHQKIEEEE
jgi:hypothetical protein